MGSRSMRPLVGAGLTWVLLGCSGSAFQGAATTSLAPDAGSLAGAGGTGGSGGAHAGSAGASSAGAGVGGALGTAGATDAGTGSGAAAGAADGGALGGMAGAAGDSGAAGVGGMASAGSAGACSAPTTWFPDDDGDTFGRSSGAISACSPPEQGGWVSVGGDCNDDNASVKPSQSSYEPESFTANAGGQSFDYDCSGTEESDPSQFGAVPSCGALSLLGCKGSGFVATGRIGPGVNPLCGSTSLVSCVSNGVACQAKTATVSEPHRCH
jgi:hypothetical protein